MDLAESEPLIRVRGLHYQYPDGTIALTGVDFDLFPGETVALLGANGSGKTTFVLHLNGLLQGVGDLTIDGLVVNDETVGAIRQKIGLVFQDSDDQLFMPSVLEDVLFGPLNLGMEKDQALRQAESALEATGVLSLKDRAPHHLSAGQKKRAAIAGVLAMEPSILILDEPTTYLDPPGRQELIRLLKELPQAKILVTHDLDFAASLASRAVFFESGRITDCGPVAGVIGRRQWRCLP